MCNVEVLADDADSLSLIAKTQVFADEELRLESRFVQLVLFAVVVAEDVLFPTVG